MQARGAHGPYTSLPHAGCRLRIAPGNGARRRRTRHGRRPPLEGHSLRRAIPIKLERSEMPMFLLAWTIIHRIDEESPFYGLNANTHADRIVALIIGFGGIDDTMAQTVHTRHVYTPEDFLYGYRFTDMIDSSTPGMLIIDHTQLDEVQPEGPNRN